MSGTAPDCGIWPPLPDQPEFDIPFKLTLSRLTPRQLEVQEIAVPESYYRIPPTMTFDFLELNSADFYEISFRIVRLQTGSGNMETMITNRTMKFSVLPNR